VRVLLGPDQLVARLRDPDELVQLEVEGLRLPARRVLDGAHHDEGRERYEERDRGDDGRIVHADRRHRGQGDDVAHDDHGERDLAAEQVADGVDDAARLPALHPAQVPHRTAR